MNILVTGGAGYIGSICVEQLLGEGMSVTVFDNFCEGHRAAVNPAATLVEGDLADRGAILAALKSSKAEAVIHFAAHALVGESMIRPAKYFHNNVANGLNLLDAALEAGVKKVVFSSSCATYGHPAVNPIPEETLQRPINPYGESKFMFERILHWYRQAHGLEYAALRFFNAAGATTLLGEHHRVETHLIPNVLKVALGQSPHCEIYGTDYPTPDGTCLRDYVHVLDLAQAHILALQPGRGGCFNLGNGEGCSVRQVVRMCEQVSGRAITALERPRRAGDPPALVANPAKAHAELGWRPLHSSLENIVATAWAWHVAHPNGYPD